MEAHLARPSFARTVNSSAAGLLEGVDIDLPTDSDADAIAEKECVACSTGSRRRTGQHQMRWLLNARPTLLLTALTFKLVFQPGGICFVNSSSESRAKSSLLRTLKERKTLPKPKGYTATYCDINEYKISLVCIDSEHLQIVIILIIVIIPFITPCLL